MELSDPLRKAVVAAVKGAIKTMTVKVGSTYPRQTIQDVPDTAIIRIVIDPGSRNLRYFEVRVLEKF